MKNKESSASKIVLDSYESLFGDQEDTGKEDRVKMIPIAELYEFAGHPFRVLDDEKMQETVESVKKYGVLVPGIARKRPQDSGGGYEIISGHRRRRACELAGLTEMPMFVRDYSDDEAVVVMVDSNIQREDILPSEKARAYRMKYDALKHQGARGKEYGRCCRGSRRGQRHHGQAVHTPFSSQGQPAQAGRYRKDHCCLRRTALLSP